MEGIFTFIHAITCVLIVTTILMQSGRGGGLTEAFSSAESMFGAKTNVFMVRITTTFTILFFITSLTLAFMSSKRERSLMAGKVAVTQEAEQMAGDVEVPVVPDAKETQKTEETTK